MKLVRVEHQDGQIRYGVLDEAMVREVEGDPFGAWEVRSNAIPLERVRRRRPSGMETRCFSSTR